MFGLNKKCLLMLFFPSGVALSACDIYVTESSHDTTAFELSPGVNIPPVSSRYKVRMEQFTGNLITDNSLGAVVAMTVTGGTGSDAGANENGLTYAGGPVRGQTSLTVEKQPVSGALRNVHNLGSDNSKLEFTAFASSSNFQPNSYFLLFGMGYRFPTPKVGYQQNVNPVYCQGVTPGIDRKVEYEIQMDPVQLTAIESSNPANILTTVTLGQFSLQKRKFTYYIPATLSLASRQQSLDFGVISVGSAPAVESFNLQVGSNSSNASVNITYAFSGVPADVTAKILDENTNEVPGNQETTTLVSGQKDLSRSVSLQSLSYLGRMNSQLTVTAQIN